MKPELTNYIISISGTIFLYKELQPAVTTAHFAFSVIVAVFCWIVMGFEFGSEDE